MLLTPPVQFNGAAIAALNNAPYYKQDEDKAPPLPKSGPPPLPDKPPPIGRLRKQKVSQCVENIVVTYR